MLRPLLVALSVLVAGALAGCTDPLTFASASVEEPDFTLNVDQGDKDTVFRVDAGGLGEHNVTWDWGDGILTYGGVSEHKYGFTNGVMTITMLVTDGSGKQGIASKTVTLGNGKNKDPTVSLRAQKKWVEVGKPVNLTATGSDTDRDPLAYRFTWAVFERDVTGPSQPIANAGNRANVTFDKAGQYEIRVTAQDPKGGQASTAIFVDVSKVIPSSVFEQTFNGTIKAGTAGAGVSEQAWAAGPTAPDTEIDAVRHAYTLKYPATTLVFLTWNDTTTGTAGVSLQDLDLEVRNADTGETVFKSETHTQPGNPPVIAPPFEFNLTAQEPGNYHLIVRGYAAANLPYTALLHANLQITPELVAQVEGQ